MYAQLVIFKTAPEKREQAETLADRAHATLKSAAGFKGATYFGDPDRNEYGALYLWENKEVLDAVMKEIMPKMILATDFLAVGTPVRSIFEVYEPKS